MAVPIRHKIVLAAIIFYAAFAWTAAAHAAIIKPSNNFGLTGYWNLDEGKGATAFDHASAPHNGTLTASPTWTTGKLGQALTFGAANNYVSTGAPWSSTNGSISVWVYPTAYADWISPAGWKTDPNTTNNGYILLDEGGSGTPGKWRAVFRPKIGGGAASEIDVLALQNIAQNTWQHLVMTWSLSGTTYTVHLYVNGVDQGSLTWTGTPGSNGVGGFNFGKSGDYADNYFKGKVDDVRIYNRVLPLSEVKALYNRTAGTRYNASSATLGNGSTLQSGLVGWWTFDGSTIGATIGDSSGQGNNGYIGGGVATSSMKVTGKLGQALTFNGNTSYVNVSDASSLDGGTGTVSFWYKIPTASGGNGYFLAGKADSSSSLNGYTVFSYNGLVGVQIKNNSTTLGLSDATIRVGGLWHHVVLTYVSGGSSSLYVDGAVVESGTAPAFTMTNQPLRLGKSVDTYWQALAGSLDDVRVYNRVLSATEVRQLYQLGGDKVASAATLQNGTTLGSGLVGYWSFNGADVTDKVYDRAGTNHGYLYNAATSSAKVQGKLGQGLNFDGAAAYVDLGDVQDQAGSFSLAAWVKRTGNSNGQAGTIIGKEMSSNHQFFLEVQDSDASNANKIRFAIWDVDTTQYSATTLQNNKWYHIVATYDDTTKAKTIYINGVSDSVVTGSGSPVANSDTLKIGYSQGTSNANNYFNGSIDEVRLYNRALSAGEVLQLYQLGK